MPTYEFKCKKCDYQFEVFVSISEKDKTKCPKCNSSKVTQLMSSFYMKGVSTPGGEKSGSSCNTCKATTCNTCSIK